MRLVNLKNKMKENQKKYDLVLEENGLLKVESVVAANQAEARKTASDKGQKLKAVVFSDQNPEDQ